jgi:hypothetical protein
LVQGLTAGEHADIELALVQMGQQLLDNLPTRRPGVLVYHGDG